MCSVLECLEELRDLMVVFEGMAETEMFVNCVVVAPAPSFSVEVSVAFEVDDDLHRRSFGDADEVGDLAKSEVGRLHDGEQDVGVVRQEGPAAGRRFARRGSRHSADTSRLATI